MALIALKVRQLNSIYPDWVVWDIRDFEGGWVAQVRLNHYRRAFYLLSEGTSDTDSLRGLKTYEEWVGWVRAHR